MQDLLSSGAGHEVVALFDLATAGSSMHPTLKHGDRVELAPMVQPSPGDIIVFHKGEQLICHRVVAIGEDGCLQVRGDAAGPDAACDRVELADVIGRVAAIIPRGRRLPPPIASRSAAALRQGLLGVAVRAARFGWWRGACTRLVARRVTVTTTIRQLGQPGRVRVARLAGRRVGTLDLTSGDRWIHPRLSGFGIEDILSNGEPR